jgi:thiamine biosynthesis lipoprotein
VTAGRSISFRALGTNVVVIVDGDGRALADAADAVEQTTNAFDLACSRFREDSELIGLRSSHGQPVTVSPLLFTAVETALRAAHLTDGRLDPTIGGPLRSLGYDRDFTFVTSDPRRPVRVTPAPGYRSIVLDRTSRTISVPPGVELDLGATAKSLCVDHAVRAAGVASHTGVLVSIGGDMAVTGPAPANGWNVQLSDDHAAPVDPQAPAVAIFAGGLATSGTSVRRWVRDGRDLHHIVDPRTGEPAAETWKTVTVVAGRCVDANIASTTSILLGEDAPAWLAGLGLPARFVAPDGRVTTVCSWPEAEPDPADAGASGVPSSGA